MKTFFINVIVICTAVSCVTQRNHNICGDVVEFETYNSKTVILIDFLNRDKIPDVLKTYYYNDLGAKDFYTPQSFISKNDSTRTIHMKSKHVNEGYLFINKYTKDFINNNGNIIYLIGKDTISSKEEVIRLIEIKRSDVAKIDTIKCKEYNLIKIN